MGRARGVCHRPRESSAARRISSRRSGDEGRLGRDGTRLSLSPSAILDVMEDEAVATVKYVVVPDRLADQLVVRRVIEPGLGGAWHGGAHDLRTST